VRHRARAHLRDARRATLTLELGFLSRRESAARVASRADARATHAGLAHARDIATGKVVGQRAVSQSIHSTDGCSASPRTGARALASSGKPTRGPSASATRSEPAHRARGDVGRAPPLCARVGARRRFLAPRNARRRGSTNVKISELSGLCAHEASPCVGRCVTRIRGRRSVSDSFLTFDFSKLKKSASN
jgi:hypothetical protein